MGANLIEQEVASREGAMVFLLIIFGILISDLLLP
jgi:hypothetical protein